MPKDPHKPKGRMSAYAYFVQITREEHKKKCPEIPVNFAEFSKKCASRWKAMSTKEKGKFDDLAKKDKVRFDEEMQHFCPPGGRKKGKKDPNAPKRPPSGFFIFCSERRPAIKITNPGMGIGETAKKLGEQWNNLTDECKQPYLVKANKLKDKYKKDMADYKSNGKNGAASMVPKPKPKVNNVEDDDDDDEDDDDDDDDDEEEDDE